MYHPGKLLHIGAMWFAIALMLVSIGGFAPVKAAPATVPVPHSSMAAPSTNQVHATNQVHSSPAAANSSNGSASATSYKRKLPPPPSHKSVIGPNYTPLICNSSVVNI